MEFKAWPKTTRLFRPIIVTEKIDGTNAAITFEDTPDGPAVGAQSRKRLVTPDDDNFGFARWVYDNQSELFSILGYGTHFGEWWGKGIQRGYGQNGRLFSLFNTSKLENAAYMVGESVLTLVPVLYEGTFSEAEIKECLQNLDEFGSRAALKFDNPEGVCVFHTQSRVIQKVTLDDEDRSKWEA